MADEASADAPGRVNLIGEHTDYHQGYVLPTVIPQRTRAHVRRRQDRRVRATSDRAAGGPQEYEVGRETRGRGWIDYIQGITVALTRHGVIVPGFDVRLESTVPVGAGVSSSAALEVSVLRALRTMLKLELDDVTIAKLAQSVETEFVGAPVGIMDQMAASLGRDGEALFIDTRTLAAEAVPLPLSMELAVIDSGVAHAHAGGEYVTRRRESFQAAAQLRLEHLRDMTPAMMPLLAQLPPVLARRVRHIVSENARVLAAVEALRGQDLERLGRLLTASHVSMRDDYEVSTPEIDTLVGIAEQHEDVYGARLTGGGFGGAVVMITKVGRAAAAATLVCKDYRRQSGRQGTVLIPTAA